MVRSGEKGEKGVREGKKENKWGKEEWKEEKRGGVREVCERECSCVYVWDSSIITATAHAATP